MLCSRVSDVTAGIFVSCSGGVNFGTSSNVGFLSLPQVLVKYGKVTSLIDPKAQT